MRGGFRTHSLTPVSSPSAASPSVLRPDPPIPPATAHRHLAQHPAKQSPLQALLRQSQKQTAENHRQAEEPRRLSTQVTELSVRLAPLRQQATRIRDTNRKLADASPTGEPVLARPSASTASISAHQRTGLLVDIGGAAPSKLRELAILGTVDKMCAPRPARSGS
jgi:hypothetical protein